MDWVTLWAANWSEFHKNKLELFQSCWKYSLLINISLELVCCEISSSSKSEKLEGSELLVVFLALYILTDKLYSSILLEAIWRHIVSSFSYSIALSFYLSQMKALVNDTRFVECCPSPLAIMLTLNSASNLAFMQRIMS